MLLGQYLEPGNVFCQELWSLKFLLNVVERLGSNMGTDELKERCKAFSLAVLTMIKLFPKTSEAQILGKQLLRSAISIAANHRAACRARSKEEFFSKLSIVVEEADETVLWLELINDSNTFKVDPNLMSESRQILYIMSSARKTTKINLQESKMSKSPNQQISK